MDEQRKFPRVMLRLSAWCEADHWTLRAPLVEVSEEGLRLRSAIPEHVGSRMRVSFRDEQGAGVIAIAEVMWSTAGPRPATGLRVVQVIEGEDTFAELLARERRS
jgi:hypothetical protein